MEYLVLARKWRPQTFEDVVGQEHVVKTLRNAIRFNRIAHAYLFSGPRGTGKTSVARILSKALNCETGPAETPCNQCSRCREITDGTALDVREIDGASNRGIDEIRELRENIKFSPASCRYKIYIIDEVHMLTKEAFNALLKTLEEPPPHVIFMFATTEIYRVPSTILSRCQHFDFRRIPLKKVIENLRHIATEEGITVTDTALMWIAQAGEGSIRDSQSVFDQVISYSGTEIRDEDVEELLSLTDRRSLFDLSKAVLESDAGRCLKIIDDVYYTGVDIKYFYQMILKHFMNLLMMSIAGRNELLMDLPDHEVETLKNQAASVSRETLQRLLDILMNEEEDIRKSMEPRINLEYTLVKMAYLEPLIPVDEILVRMEGLEKRLSPGGAKPPEKMPPVQVPSAETAAGKPRQERREPPARGGGEQLWEDFKEYLCAQNKPLWSKIVPGAFLGYDDGSLKIGFPKDYIFFETLQERDQREKLTRFASEFFGEETTVQIVPLQGADSQRNGPVAKRSVEERKSQALRHPRLQTVLDVFKDATIKDVRVENDN